MGGGWKFVLDCLDAGFVIKNGEHFNSAIREFLKTVFVRIVKIGN
jgi:hypothetical protein